MFSPTFVTSLPALDYRGRAGACISSSAHRMPGLPSLAAPYAAPILLSSASQDYIRPCCLAGALRNR